VCFPVKNPNVCDGVAYGCKGQLLNKGCLHGKKPTGIKIGLMGNQKSGVLKWLKCVRKKVINNAFGKFSFSEHTKVKRVG